VFIIRQSQNQFLIQDLAKKPKVRVSLGAFEKESLLEPKADLVLVARDKGLPQGWEKLKDKPFLVNSPGEYEVKGVGIQAMAHDGKLIYLLRFGQEKLAYLLQPSQRELTPRQMDQITEANFLLISLDGKGLGPDKTATLISQLEPPVVIPMDYESHHLQRLAEILGGGKIEEESSLATSKLSLIPENTLVRALSISS